MTASDGKTAIAMASGWQPDLVLLDIQLPGMDGYAVARAPGIIEGLGPGAHHCRHLLRNGGRPGKGAAGWLHRLH